MKHSAENQSGTTGEDRPSAQRFISHLYTHRLIVHQQGNHKCTIRDINCTTELILQNYYDGFTMVL